MTTSIKLKKSSISGRIPSTSDLDYGELAINYADGILYFKNSSNQVSSINARAIGVDSTATFSIIDSAYIESRVGNTTNIAEGTNLYYTSTRADSDAKNAISVSDAGGDGALSYNSTTGVLTYTGPSAAEVRAHFSAAGDITYNSSTGQFSLDVESVYTADNFDSDYILAKDSANTAVERNKHDATTKNFSVTVASKTADHVYNGTGSGSGYVIDGTQSPIVQLQIGRTYRFTLSSSDMSNHPFRFYYDAGRTTQYTTNVTTTSTYAEIEITESTPTVLHYQCSAHGYMGHAFVIGTRNLTGFNTDNLSEGSSNVYYSNTRVETLVDSSYVQSRQINNPTGVDSSATIDLVDSAYVQARQINNPTGVDSSATIALVDSSYVQSRQIKYTNDDFADSAFVTSQINSLIDAAPGALNTLNELAAAIGDDANFSTTVTNSIATKLTSAQATNLIDSAYVQLRQINNPSGVDSSATIDLVDSAYVQARQINNPTGVDSAATIALVDSAYVQLRQINNPSGVDSAATIDLVDSAYIQSRQTTTPSGVDSAATIALVDSAYVNAFTIDANTLNGQNASYYLDYGNLNNVPSEFTDSSTVDSIILNVVDSAYVQTKFGTLRESNNSLVVSGSIIPETDSAFSLGTAQKKFKDLHLSGGTVFLDNLALSADPATQTINIGQIDSIGIVNVVGVIATVDSAGVSAIVDSAFLEARLGDFVSETELTSKNFTTFDSADATSVIDSSYINSLNADAGALNGQSGAHYLDYNNFTNTPQGGVDYGTVIQSATSAIDILDILIAQTTVDYGTVGSPGSLKSNYGTL
ncbi:hypothetical protein N9961_01595 [bacterium]|nr:hypothetical protein [bacterium]